MRSGRWRSTPRASMSSPRRCWTRAPATSPPRSTRAWSTRASISWSWTRSIWIAAGGGKASGPHSRRRRSPVFQGHQRAAAAARQAACALHQPRSVDAFGGRQPHGIHDRHDEAGLVRRELAPGLRAQRRQLVRTQLRLAGRCPLTGDLDRLTRELDRCRSPLPRTTWATGGLTPTVWCSAMHTDGGGAG